MDISALPKLSSDSHVDEPHDLWYDRLPESMRDLAPRRILGNEQGGFTLVVDGSPIGWMSSKGRPMAASEANALEEARFAAIMPDVRLEMMRTDNINGEIVLPTIGLYVWSLTDPEVGAACCRIYNDWILERLGGNPRIKLGVMIPAWNLEGAIAEIERMAPNPSVGGFMLPIVGTPEWNMPEWESLWSVLAAAGKPAVMHQGTGHEMMFYRGWGSATTNILATQSIAPRTAGLLSCSGILERHPDLHVVMVEVNAGWVAWAMHLLDEYYEAHRHWSKPKLSEMPSQYIRRQIHATFQDDAVAIHNLPLTGSDVLLWGNDYPHPESVYPNSEKVLKRILADVSDAEAKAITYGNAQKLFGFDDAVLTSRP